MKEGRYREASESFSGIANALPSSPVRADAWFWASIAEGKLQNFEDAISSCEEAISTCRSLLVVDYSVRPPETGNVVPVDSVKDLMCRALRHKADLCASAGRLDQALAVIYELRGEFAEYPLFRKALDLQARIQGIDAEILKAQEHAAWLGADEAKWAWERGDSQHSLQWADYVMERFPDTAGAMLARRCRAGVLWKLKSFDEARSLYRGLLDELSLCPDSEIAREARSRIAYSDAAPRLRGLIRRCQTRERGSIEPGEWEQVRENCTIVMQVTTDPVVRAQAHLMMIESYYWQGEAQATKDSAVQFLRTYGDTEEHSFKEERAAARFMLADKHRESGNYEKAISHYRQLIEAHQVPDPIDLGPELLARLYYRLWWTLDVSGGTNAELGKIERALVSLAPDSSYVECIQVIKRQKENRNAR